MHPAVMRALTAERERYLLERAEVTRRRDTTGPAPRVSRHRRSQVADPKRRLATSRTGATGP
jgi:hypothetical protein